MDWIETLWTDRSADQWVGDSGAVTVPLSAYAQAVDLADVFYDYMVMAETAKATATMPEHTTSISYTMYPQPFILPTRVMQPNYAGPLLREYAILQSGVTRSIILQTIAEDSAKSVILETPVNIYLFAQTPVNTKLTAQTPVDAYGLASEVSND
jgi:hypothetical protein